MPFFPHREDYKKKQLKIESAGKDVERLEPLYISDRGSDVGVLPPRETACASQNTKTFIRPQILPLGIYREGFKTGAVYFSVSSSAAHRI